MFASARRGALGARRVTAAQASVKTANAIANGARPASGPAAPPSSAGATLATTTPTQRESLADRGDPRPADGIRGELRAPGVVVDHRHRVRGVDQRQRGDEPGETTEVGLRRRHEQRDHAGSQHRRGQRYRHAPRAQAVAPHAQQRVDEAVEEAQHEEHRAEDGEVDAERPAVELGQVHVQRQRGHRQRHREQPVRRGAQQTGSAGKLRVGGGAPQRPRRSLCGAVHGCSFRSLLRKSRREVRGSSQMPKNARANSRSTMSPIGRPLWK